MRRSAATTSDKRKEMLEKRCEKNSKKGNEGLAKSCAKSESAEKAKAASLLKSEKDAKKKCLGDKTLGGEHLQSI